ncbi:MAG: type VII secretion protein EssC [Vulcanimicrobiota bacterium]
MSTQRIFQRSPRILPVIPRGEEEIRSPEAAPSAPSANLSSRMEDVVFTGGASIAGAAFMAAFTHSGASTMIGGVSMFFFGVLRGVVGYRREVRQYKKACEQRVERQTSYLESRRDALSTARDQQLQSSLTLDPHPEECARRADSGDLRLFERTPADQDFLSIRLGLGLRPFSIHLKAQPADHLQQDPMALATARLASEFTLVDGLPICANFRDLGPAGLTGARAEVVKLARSLIVQLATHHSADEVKLVVISPQEENWKWCRWLPHVWSDEHQRRYLACDRDGAQALLDDLNDMLRKRLLRRQDQDENKRALELPIYVLLLASPSLVGDHPICSLLEKNSSALGCLPIFFGDTIQNLPQTCRTIAEASQEGARLISTIDSTDEAFIPDHLPRKRCEQFARALAGFRIKGAAGASDIPTRAGMLELLGVKRIEDYDALGVWKRNAPFKSMAVPIGLQGGDKRLELNLHETGQGPHGLVAGTTGSGKTAFLSTFLGIMATQFHPHEVSFVCVDYKGGDLFRGLEELPHLVGTLTNLEKSEVWRCLKALTAENERRMRLFSQATASSGVAVNKIDEYQELYRQGRAPEPLAKLLIVCDEFAELSKQEPEFIGRLVSIARVGRSLGVHLILATQQPAGIIGDQIESNTRFRIAFKFNKEEDSKAVIKRPEAASIRQSGRAYFQLGENEMFELFQAAYGGGEYKPAAEEVVEEVPAISLIELDGRRKLLSGGPSAAAESKGKSRVELQEMSHHLAVQAELGGIKRLPGPWLPPLPRLLTLAEVQTETAWDGQKWGAARRWLVACAGLLDDPGRSFQGPLEIDLAQDGHIAIFGRPGAGSTSLMLSLLISLVRQHSPAELQLYIMDFGGKALARLRQLPHVGDVVFAEDVDRTQRLLRFMLRQIQKRKDTLAGAGVTTLASYRAAGHTDLPAIVVVLDNYVKFSKDHAEAEDLLAALVQEGGNLGVYLMLSANSPGGLKPKTGGNINSVLCLQLADRTEYAVAVGRTEGMEPAAILGRGLVKAKPPLEFQACLAFEGSSEVERAGALDLLAASMQKAWNGPAVPPIPVVPDQVTLDLLIPKISMDQRGPFTSVPIGLDIEDVVPFKLAPADGPHFFFTGSMQSGKTNLLTVWALSLAAHMSPDDLDLTVVDFREGLLQPLSRLPHVRKFADDEDSFGDALDRLRNIAEERKSAMKAARMEAGGVLDEAEWATSQPTYVMLIDDFESLRSQGSALNQEDLINLIKACRGPGVHIVLAGSVDDMGSNTYDGIYKAIASYKSGFLLATRDDNGVFNNVRIPAQSEDFSRGMGYFVQRGSARNKVRIARPGVEARGLLQWLERFEQHSNPPQEVVRVNLGL